MSKSDKKKLEKAHRAFKRRYPDSYCYNVVDRSRGIIFYMLHLGYPV